MIRTIKKIVTMTVIVGLVVMYPGESWAKTDESQSVGSAVAESIATAAGTGLIASSFSQSPGATAGAGIVLLASGALLATGYGIFYAAKKDKNYQAFVNQTYKPVTINIDYHVCKVDDTFNLDHGQNAVYYPKACQPKTITIYAKGTNKVLGQRSFNVGEDGGRHGNWEIVKGASGDELVIKERQMKGLIANRQWVANFLDYPVKITLSYFGESEFLKSCRQDAFTLQPGGNASVAPGGCILKNITVGYADTQAPSVSREFKAHHSGVRHGSWHIIPDKENGIRIDGPIE